MIKTKILDINVEKERVSLGLKQLSQNPWENISEKYTPGKKVKGKVVNIMPYGAFIEIENGVEETYNFQTFIRNAHMCFMYMKKWS